VIQSQSHLKSSISHLLQVEDLSIPPTPFYELIAFNQHHLSFLTKMRWATESYWFATENKHLSKISIAVTSSFMTLDVIFKNYFHPMPLT